MQGTLPVAVLNHHRIFFLSSFLTPGARELTDPEITPDHKSFTNKQALISQLYLSAVLSEVLLSS